MAYINTAEVTEIRNALKVKFGKKFKFSVRRRDHHAVTVAILSGPTDFSAMWEGLVPGDYGHGHSSINTYHITKDRYGKHVKLFNEIVDIIKTAPAKAPNGRAWFDESDSMVDYFHTAFYFDLDIGKWDRPYTVKV